MIPIIRSFAELMVLTESRDEVKMRQKVNIYNISTKDSAQRKRYIKSKDPKKVRLPDIQVKTREKWNSSKEAVSRFFDTLDYNNQIQSSYDLTLLKRQENHVNRDAA